MKKTFQQQRPTHGGSPDARLRDSILPSPVKTQGAQQPMTKAGGAPSCCSTRAPDAEHQNSHIDDLQGTIGSTSCLLTRAGACRASPTVMQIKQLRSRSGPAPRRIARIVTEGPSKQTSAKQCQQSFRCARSEHAREHDEASHTDANCSRRESIFQASAKYELQPTRYLSPRTGTR